MVEGGFPAAAARPSATFFPEDGAGEGAEWGRPAVPGSPR